jgi:glycosyltransferase involved in cell wall biosynthesis
MRSLYICYFGLREPLVQTQVLPYLREIGKGGVDVSLLTFEPNWKNWFPDEAAATREDLSRQGIKWFALAYHKSPSLPATLYDIAAGVWFTVRYARREQVDILHARGHVPAMIGALAKLFTNAKMLFDIRGFMPEEYTDAGVWPENGYLYKLVKRTERWLLRSSDAFVVLTEKARKILFGDHRNTDSEGRPIEVIPCCIDSRRFSLADAESRSALRSELKIANRRVIIYVGALGGWYLIDQMAEFFSCALKQNANSFALIISQSDPKLISSRLYDRGMTDADFLVRKVAPSDVPRYIAAADIGLSFIKACYSKQSSSPTKIAEYLAGGVPIVCNSGVGDLDELILTDNLGVLINEFREAAYVEALENIDRLRENPDLTKRCRESAQTRFDLETVGGVQYRRLYARMNSG